MPMAGMRQSTETAARAEDYSPEILHLMLWGGFLMLLLAMLAPQFFNVKMSSDEVVNRAQFPIHAPLSHDD